MPMTLPGYRPPVEYLFVDGGCLDQEVKAVVDRWWPGEAADIDYAKLGASFAKCFYYDAWPRQRDGQGDDAYRIDCELHDERIDKISSAPNWHAYAGETRHRKKRGLEQKMVDVMIAVDMLRHSFNGNMERCTLLTSDLDFKPLLDALVQQGMMVNLWHGPMAPRDLKRAADNLRPLNLLGVHAMMTRDWIAAHALPQHSGGTFDPSGRTVLEIGLTSSGGEWVLWESRDTEELTLTWKDTINIGNTMIVSSRSRDRISMFVEDLYGWTLPAAPQP